MNKNSTPSDELPAIKRALGFLGRLFFASRETVVENGEEREIRRTFRYKGPKISELIECVPTRRSDDTPLQLKHRRALNRALLRGRRSQIQRKVTRLTGIVFT